MHNDDAPVGVIYSRREALSLAAKAGLCLGSVGLVSTSFAHQSKSKVNLIASPALTEGPFFVDEKLNRSNLLAGTTREAVIKGIPLEIELALYKIIGDKHEPFAGCQVDIWHCDAKGVYSDESNPMNHEDTSHQAWLRGYQLADAKGIVKFQTIVPGSYPGRTAHVHFKIRKASAASTATADFTSQLFFHEADLEKAYAKAPYDGQPVPAGTNMRDGIFAHRQMDGSVAGNRLLLDLTSSGKGYKSKFAIALNDSNFAVRPSGQSRPDDLRPSGGWESF